MHLTEIAQKFKIFTKNGQPNISLVYDTILSHSNKRQFILLESGTAVFDSVYAEIIETRDRLLSDNYVFLELTNRPSVPIGKKGDPYIYFLFNSGVLVYIGQTKNLLARIACHIINKDFNETCAFLVDKDKLSLIETLNIMYYKPILNQTEKEPLSLFLMVLNHCCFE